MKQQQKPIGQSGLRKENVFFHPRLDNQFEVWHADAYQPWAAS